MVDTPRSQAALITASADNTSGAWLNQNERDFIVTIVPTGQTLTSGASITMSTTRLVINKTSGSATAVTLPVTPITWTQRYTIKDGKGDCATNNITVTPSSGTVDNQSSLIMNRNGMSVDLDFDGTNWWVV